MFFGSHLEVEAEEDAGEAWERPAPAPPTPPAPAPEPATPPAPAPEPAASTPPKPKPTPVEPRVRLAGVVEQVKVEITDAACVGERETLTLPDGRAVAFRVPAHLKVGDFFDVDAKRVTYDAKNPSPVPKRTTMTRDELAAFFRDGVTMMRSPETRKALRDRTSKERPGAQLVERQQTLFDAMHVDRNAGCRMAGTCQADYADDDELKALHEQFMATAQHEFIGALEDLKPSKLKRSGTFPKKAILEFFDACNTKMQLPATRELLAKQFVATKQPPNELMIKLQKDMLETLGFEREWACGKLNRIGQDFGEDRELSQGMQAWASMAQQACRRAQDDGLMRSDTKEMQQIADLQKGAREELATMSLEDKAAFLQKLGKRVQVFNNLSAADRLRYVTKLSPEDRRDFVKAQVLMMEQGGLVPK